MEHIRTWMDEGFRLDVYDTHCTDTLGKCRLAYEFFRSGELVWCFRHQLLVARS